MSRSRATGAVARFSAGARTLNPSTALHLHKRVPLDSPPYSLDAEEAVLSAIFMEAEVIRAVEKIVTESMFSARNGHIFRTMVALADRGHAIDPITLHEELVRTGEADAAGGKDHIISVVDAVPTAANVSHHAQIVREKAARRRVKSINEQFAREIAGGVPTIDALRRHQLELQGVASQFGPLSDEKRSRLYSAKELDELPEPTWIIDNGIPANGIVAVIGAKGHKKTFVVLDLALHAAAGLPEWQGRRVQACPVIYIYAEGAFGAKSRVEAWCRYQSYVTGREINRSDLAIWFLPSRCPINDPAAVAQLLAEIRNLNLPTPPGIVVIDTLNMNLDGDENGEGMGGFVNGSITIRDALGATVMPVHHTPLGSDDRGRGHSSFDGAVDTRLIVSCDKDRVTVECTHQRNGPSEWEVAFEALPVAGSLVLKPSGPDGGQLAGQRRQLLEQLYQGSTATSSGWQTATGLGKGSFQKARKWLVARRYVKLDGRNYSVTEAGEQALSTVDTPEVHYA